MRILRRTPLAWKNLTHDVRRLAIAVCGIGFAVVLMFMETGFENALFDSTLQVLRKLDGQIVLASKAQYSLLAAETFPLARVYQARGCPGVQGAYPLYMECFGGLWKTPGEKAYPIRVLAFEPGDPVLAMPDVDRYAQALRAADTALVDLRSKSMFRFPKTEEEVPLLRGAELGGRAVRPVGGFRMGTDFANDGNVVMSADNFAKYFAWRVPGGDPLSQVDMAVVHVEPGADVRQVQAALRNALPDDVCVYTKEGFIDHEVTFWRKSTPVGFVFLVGTVVGFIVGVIICYQVIQANIAESMSEFATLKAMGYPNRFFVAVVLQMALYLSVLSFLPGMLVSLVLYARLADYTGLLMVLTPGRAAGVFGLTALMCTLSGCLAIRKVMAADPAELF